MEKNEYPITVYNHTGWARYCEECGERMKPGEAHECFGPDEEDSDDE